MSKISLFWIVPGHFVMRRACLGNTAYLTVDKSLQVISIYKVIDQY